MFPLDSVKITIKVKQNHTNQNIKSWCSAGIGKEV